MRKFTLPVFAAACFAAIATPAAAAEVTVRVDVADLDLTNPADIAVVKGRIAEATDKACRNKVGSPLFNAAAFEDCSKASTQLAFEQLEKRQALASAELKAKRT
ncbi:UrcA family protein [Altericroceibacterium spongiae]|uniref:UrcA family protein n=1 Tax=Altericroceibacterium spongiae TaxID=2320269 RepID=A0A420EPG3_9SPHN|nr:UrcA family protein [Altericroceibacterium spongiae]RKF22560.1 UrcA family protein [Altericroceibacterium spongiae]